MRTSKPSKTRIADGLAHELTQTRLAIEKAKLAKLEGDLPQETPHYTRYEDLPPLSPEDQARFKQELLEIYGATLEDEARRVQAKRDWLLRLAPDWP